MEALVKSSDPDPPKKAQIDIKTVENKELEDFVTTNTKTFFSILGLSSAFLSKPVEEWPHDKSYCIARNVVKQTKVVNDTAERGVKLMEDYNKIITNDEQQNQYLLQVVSNY